MTFPRYRKLSHGWRKYPPLAILVQAATGYQPPPETAEFLGKVEVSDSLDDLIRDFAAAGGVLNR